MRAVADTGPLHYLVLAGHIQIVGDLFREVAIPDAVRESWPIQGAGCRAGLDCNAPAWLSVNSAAPEVLAQVDASLDPGKRAALALATERQPELVLMDDRAGVAAAHAQGFVVTGTLGLLVRAARRGLLDLPSALNALGHTNFRWTSNLRARVLAEHMKEPGQ